MVYRGRDEARDEGRGLEGEVRRGEGTSFFTRLRRGLATIVTAGIIGTALFYNTCTTYVKPNEQGIMQVDISPFGVLGAKGIQNKDYDAGVYVVLPVFQKMHKFPKDLQVLNLNMYPQKEDMERGYVRMEQPAHIQTSDGFFIDLDVSIVYRIADPYKVITTIGAGKLYEDNGIVPKAEPALKETLGKLNPEDFYNSIVRVQKQNEARDLLNVLLEEKGIHVEHVLVRYPKYHPNIQERIEGRKLQDQLVFTNMAQAAAAQEEAQLKKATEEGKAAVLVVLQDGQAYVTRKTAEMDLYSRVKKAEADLLVNLAKAKRTELVNNAYQGEGADKLVGLAMAEVLRGIDTIVLMTGGPGSMNPLDLQRVVETFEGKKLEQKNE